MEALSAFNYTLNDIRVYCRPSRRLGISFHHRIHNVYEDILKFFEKKTMFFSKKPFPFIAKQFKHFEQFETINKKEELQYKIKTTFQRIGNWICYYGLCCLIYKFRLQLVPLIDNY